MNKKNTIYSSNRKGVTLVEMALVLIVIGVLLGISLKAKTLIEAARVKSQINNVSKLSGAFSSYYAKYGSFPGSAGDGRIVSTADLFHALTKEGLLKETDFSSSFQGGSFGWWAFTGCKDLVDIWQEQAPTSKSSICVVKVATPSKTNTTPGGNYTKNSNMDGMSVCLYETLLDDKNINKGDGRLAKKDGSIGNKVNTATWDCNIAKNPGTNIPYLYKIW